MNSSDVFPFENGFEFWKRKILQTWHWLMKHTVDGKRSCTTWAPDMLASSRYQDLVVHPKWCRILSINPMIKLNEIQTCSSMDLSAIIQQLLTFELCCVHWGFFSQSTAGVVSFCWGCSGAPFRDLKRIISLISWVCWKTILLGTDIPLPAGTFEDDVPFPFGGIC